MIGHRSGVARSALHHVEPVHLVFGFADTAPRGEVTGVSQLARAGRKKIGVERDDDVGFCKIIACRSVCPEGQLGALPHWIAIHSLVLVPLCGWKVCQQPLKLSVQRRRSYSLSEESQASTLVGFEPL